MENLTTVLPSKSLRRILDDGGMIHMEIHTKVMQIWFPIAGHEYFVCVTDGRFTPVFENGNFVHNLGGAMPLETAKRLAEQWPGRWEEIDR